MTLLDLLGFVEVDLPHTATLEERFARFDELNPQVYRALEHMVAGLVERGRTKVSLKMCVEVLRWNFFMRTNDPSAEYRLNNSYTSRYARLLVQRNLQWEGLFEMRGLRS